MYPRPASAPLPCAVGTARRHATALLLTALLSGLPATALAHGDLHERLATLTRRIDRAPTAALHLQRGELLHEHGDYADALADYDRAAALAPELDAVAYARARTLFAAGRPGPAREALAPFLQRQPGHAAAHLLRAHIHAALKDHAAVVQDYDRHLALAPQPQPEAYLERAAALSTLGQTTAALQSLDEALARLGNLVTLQSAAIDLELAQNHYDGALARVDRILTGLARKETWLARRGEILDAAGRPGEARLAYAEALAALEQLPAPLRNLKPTRELRDRLRRRLAP